MLAAFVAAALVAAPPVDAAAAPAATPAVAAPAVSVANGVVRAQRQVGSTIVELIIADGDVATATAAVDAAVAEIARVQALFSATDGSIKQLSDANGAAVTVPPEVFAVLLEVQRIAKLSKGAYDPSVAAYADAWGFASADKPAAVPAPTVLAEKKALVGVDVLVLDPVQRTARLKVAGARLDIEDVVVGYALDRARGLLIEAGLDGFIVGIDGNVVGHGRKGDVPWLVGVQDPRGTGPFLTVALDEKNLGGAVMTVSDNDGAFFVDDKRQHRLLDPRSGLPATASRSATVFHGDALTAACLARAALVLGSKDGLALVERARANAVVVGNDNAVALTKGLKKLATAGVLQQRAPTDAP